MSNPVTTISTPEQALRKEWGNNIRQGRKLLGLTQHELAAKLGVYQSALSRWEDGSVRPTDEHKVAIANALGQEVWALFPLHRGSLA